MSSRGNGDKAPLKNHVAPGGGTCAPFDYYLPCWCSAGNEGMTPINHPLWLPFRGPLGSFPHSLQSTSKILPSVLGFRFCWNPPSQKDWNPHSQKEASQKKAPIAHHGRDIIWRVRLSNGHKRLDPRSSVQVPWLAFKLRTANGAKEPLELRGNRTPVPRRFHSSCPGLKVGLDVWATMSE